jgi:autotransporter-associated beta strand protein
MGAGPLTLLGNNQFTGPTLITEGSLVLGPNAALASSLITVESFLDASAVAGGWILGAGQTLSGKGTVIGPLTGPGTLEPGTSIGKLTIQGDATLAGATVMEISKTGSLLTNDLLACTGTLTPGGSLMLTNVGVEALVPGDTFKLFAAATFGAGSFASVELPRISGVAWDTSRLNTEGIVMAIAGEPGQPPSLDLTSSNGNLTISWPTNYATYALQAQTNNPGEGLSPGWFPVPGVTNNSFTIPIDATTGSVFYRLLKQ